MSDEHGIPICDPRVELCLACGEEHVYYCGRLLLLRDVENEEERCLGGTFICGECYEPFTEFMERAHDAQAREAEWKV